MAAESKSLCKSCREKFTKAQAVRYEYFPDTSICYDCYAAGRAEDHRKWCFGKEDVTEGETTTRYGYDPKRWECGKVCPDRAHCPIFIVKDYSIKGKVINTSKVDLFRKTGRKQEV